MKKTVVASSVLLALTISGVAIANEKINPEEAELKAKLSALENEYSKAELLTALNAEPREDSKLHGTIGTNVEIEQWKEVKNGEVLNNGGKVKYSLANGNFRHEDWAGVDFGFYMAREFNYSGELFSADHDGVNDITEIYLNKSYAIDNGSIGWGVKYAQESADKRSTPEGKVFGSYQINDWLDFHGYALYHVEIKQNLGNFDYYELEPGFGFKIAKNMGAWINFRYQQGVWDAKGDSDKEVETETIIKPGMWYSFGHWSAALFAEIGKFDKENDRTGASLHSEDYVKLGASANYPISKNWSVFGEFSYKTVDVVFGDGQDGENTLPFGLIGVNYSF
ncbi:MULTISPECIES: OmpG porin family protein [Vibrio]|uniref:OmpG porin family protein n=1 Tax=Vibrio TaxID=662 RepID=UPI0001B9506D|nr:MULTISPECIES: OmpG porin family protein [Vibrio]EEX32207.1 Aec44 [Vibrio coralliilyticus ATCC BAA-450]MCM5510502.1 hypothetical protein [Vibrio sp. SCSIO 43169]MDE3897834.1 hypothetical protein [Vibrio sp. CC007]QFT39492.1 hypothetical protein FIU99_24205 [Vibrio sp. THAF64]QGM35970.1 hypothetical protein GGC04_17025 [Vibrio sp. THAF191d]